MSKRILFFGNERLATGVTTTAPTLQALIDNGYEVAAVVVAQNDLGKSRNARELEVSEIAEKHNIPLLSPADLKAAKDELATYQAEAAVLIAYGKIVPAETLELFPAGIINIHPSLLPLHRGSTPIEGAILEGAAETGVSLMKLSQKMDAGPLYGAKTVALARKETKQELAEKLSSIGKDMLLEQLPAILDGTATATDQDESNATYGKHITKPDGVIDWTKPAVQLEREVRAYAGWPRSRTSISGIDVIITSSQVVDGAGTPGEVKITGKELAIGTGESLLVIDKLVPAGKREMTAEAFLAGHKSL